MIVTSNKHFERWGEVLGEAVAATAMIDRLVHHADVVFHERRQLPLEGFCSPALPDAFEVVPMRQLTWRTSQRISEPSGLSTLGSEAVAEAEALDARLLVLSKDDSPGVRGACRTLRMRYTTLVR